MTAFYDCCDQYQLLKSKSKEDLQGKDWREYYAGLTKGSDENWEKNCDAGISGVLWRKAGRPFYRIWPDAASMLAQTSLDICPSQVPVQTEVVCIQMPKAKGIFDMPPEDCPCSILGAFCVDFWWFFLTYPDGRDFHISYKISENIKNDIDKWFAGETRRFVELPLKIFFGSMILASQSEMIERVLLSKDIKRGSDSEDALQKAIKRAISRGVNGFDIGRRIKIDRKSGMHVRRPHFGLRWTGKGREIPKLVPISGCIVNVDRLKRMPEGYLDKQQSTESQS